MRQLFIYLSALFACHIDAQRIVSFNLYPLNNSVVVKFTIGPGGSCTGYTIWHGIDSVNFVPVFDELGECGNTGTNEEKSYTHSNPAPNQVNYYKVQLRPYETTPIKSIYVTEQGRGR